MRSSRVLHVSRGAKADPCSMTRPMRCSVRHSKSLSVAPAAMTSLRSRRYTTAALVRVHERLLFKECGEQVEELPLTLVEMLSSDHGATPLGSPPLFLDWLRVILFLLNEHAGHRLAATAVVVDETTSGTSDFPRANRDRSGPGVGCAFVAAFDGKGGTAFLTQESEVPAGCSHGRSFSAVPRVGRRIIASPRRSRGSCNVLPPGGRRPPPDQGRSRQRPLR